MLHFCCVFRSRSALAALWAPYVGQDPDKSQKVPYMSSKWRLRGAFWSTLGPLGVCLGALWGSLGRFGRPCRVTLGSLGRLWTAIFQKSLISRSNAPVQQKPYFLRVRAPQNGLGLGQLRGQGSKNGLGMGQLRGRDGKVGSVGSVFRYVVCQAVANQ